VVAQGAEPGDVTVRHDQQVAEIGAAALVEWRQVESGDCLVAQEEAARYCHVAAKLTAWWSTVPWPPASLAGRRWRVGGAFSAVRVPLLTAS